MAIIDKTLEMKVATCVLKEHKKERENHIPSGKLSASMLGQPLQWQMLKVFGASGDVDEYTLRKFQRGKDVEFRILKWLNPNKPDEQEKVEYRGVIGFMDDLVDTSDWAFKKGIIPHEIKSVTNMKFKRVVAQGKPDRGHCLQGCLYALAKKAEWFAVTYVASDDYRLLTYLIPVSDYKEEVDRIIDRFNAQVMLGTIPVFVADEKWQESPKYNNFPEWQFLTQEQIEKKLEALIKLNKKKK